MLNSFEVKYYEDHEQLLTLANGCPDRDGASVYQVRVLYNTLHQTFRNFEDSCGSIANNSRKATGTLSDQALNGNRVLEIYPNPNNGYCMINLKDAGINTMHLKVYDVHGKIVYEDNNNSLSEKLYELQLDVCNGIYLLDIIDLTNQVRYKQKIVVNR